MAEQKTEKARKRRSLRDWPLRWPLSLFCSHPSTVGLRVEQEDGSWRDEDVTCIRCGRALTTSPEEK